MDKQANQPSDNSPVDADKLQIIADGYFSLLDQSIRIPFSYFPGNKYADRTGMSSYNTKQNIMHESVDSVAYAFFLQQPPAQELHGFTKPFLNI